MLLCVFVGPFHLEHAKLVRLSFLSMGPKLVAPTRHTVSALFRLNERVTLYDCAFDALDVS